MAALSVPPIAELAAAAAVLAEAYRNDRPRVNALNKAALMLHEGVRPVVTAGGFLVESRTRNLVHRVDSVRGCTCEAGQASRPCWHAAVLEIIEQAQMRHIPLAAKLAAARTAKAEIDRDLDARRARWTQAQREVEELYA